MTTARLDVASSEDLFYVPFAKKLLWQAKTTLRAQGVMEFTRHYQFSDVAIFIRVWQGGDYIRVRAGKPGDFLVLPVVRKISTSTTTTGTPTFLNGKLTKADPAPDFTNLLAIQTRVSAFPHRTLSKRYIGLNQVTPDLRRGYFDHRALKTLGAAQINSYGGVFKQGTEFLHARSAAAAPSTNPADGLYYNNPALGDQLARLVDFTTARRPALSDSMYVSSTGRKIVTEEQFAVGNTLGFQDLFVIRSIIDVNLSAEFDKVQIHDYSNLGPYSVADMNANGTGVRDETFIQASDDGLGSTSLLSTRTRTKTGTLVYPVSTSIVGDALVHTNANILYDTNDNSFFHTTGSNAAPGGIRRDIMSITSHDKVTLSLTATGLATQSLLLQDKTETGGFDVSAFYQGAGTVPASLGVTQPTAVSELTGTVAIHYSDTSIPAILYTYETESTRYVYDPPTVSPNGGQWPTMNGTLYRSHMIRVVAVVGQKTTVLSEESSIDYATASGSSIGTSQWSALVSLNTHTVRTLPDVTHEPNIYHCANRMLKANVEMAAQTKKIYLGSANLFHTPFAVADPADRKRMTFSHDDVALKKTIVNHVLAPVEPIVGPALDDYQFWFTAIRVIS